MTEPVTVVIEQAEMLSMFLGFIFGSLIILIMKGK